MAKFKFIGDPKHKGHGPDEVEIFGHIITRDAAGTEVADATAVRKLSAHTHFAAVEDGEPEPQLAPVPEPEPEPEPAPAAPTAEDGEPEPAWPDEDAGE